MGVRRSEYGEKTLRGGGWRTELEISRHQQRERKQEAKSFLFTMTCIGLSSRVLFLQILVLRLEIQAWSHQREAVRVVSVTYHQPLRPVPRL